MIADSLLIWAAVSQHRILLWPWLVLYAVEYVLLVALLVYFMVVLPKTYLKVSPLLSLTFCRLRLELRYSLFEGDRVLGGVPVPRRLLLLLVRRQVLLQLPAGPQPQGGRRGRVRAVAAKVPRRLKSSDRLPDRSATALGSGIISSIVFKNVRVIKCNLL